LTTGLLAAGVMMAATVSTAIVGVGSVGASSPLGAAHPATLAPVTVGMILDAGGSGVNEGIPIETGAKAAIAYQNKYGNGLEGHKINISFCENQSTPAGGQTCANDLVQQGVVAVIEAFTDEGATEVPTIINAGIPYIVVGGISAPELTSAGEAFSITGGAPADIGAFALSAKAHHYKKVAFLVDNVAAAIQGVQDLGGILFKAADVGLDVIPVNPGTADVTPQLQAAVSSGADAVGVFGDVSLCSSFFQAYNTLNLKLPRYALSQCQDPSILNSPTLDKALAGSYMQANTTPTKAELAFYAALMKKYAPSVSPNPNVSTNQAFGVQSILSLANIMKGSTQPVTAAGIKAAAAAAKNVPIPLSGSLTFSCNGTAIPILKSVCSAAVGLGVIQAGKTAKVSHIKVYNSTQLFSS
jgi:branched-chain amino acid transport system substrate-binding protein